MHFDLSDSKGKIYKRVLEFKHDNVGFIHKYFADSTSTKQASCYLLLEEGRFFDEGRYSDMVLLLSLSYTFQNTNEVGHTKAALRDVKSATKACPGYLPAHKVECRFLKNTGKVEEAAKKAAEIIYFEEALELCEVQSCALLRVGWISKI